MSEKFKKKNLELKKKTKLNSLELNKSVTYRVSKSSIIFFTRVEFSVCPKQSNLLRAQVINITAKGRKEALYSRLSPAKPKGRLATMMKARQLFWHSSLGQARDRPPSAPTLTILPDFYSACHQEKKSSQPKMFGKDTCLQ